MALHDVRQDFCKHIEISCNPKLPHGASDEYSPGDYEQQYFQLLENIQGNQAIQIYRLAENDTRLSGFFAVRVQIVLSLR